MNAGLTCSVRAQWFKVEGRGLSYSRTCQRLQQQQHKSTSSQCWWNRDWDQSRQLRVTLWRSVSCTWARKTEDPNFQSQRETRVILETNLGDRMETIDDSSGSKPWHSCSKIWQSQLLTHLIPVSLPPLILVSSTEKSIVSLFVEQGSKDCRLQKGCFLKMFHFSSEQLLLFYDFYAH